MDSLRAEYLDPSPAFGYTSNCSFQSGCLWVTCMMVCFFARKKKDEDGIADKNDKGSERIRKLLINATWKTSVEELKAYLCFMVVMGIFIHSVVSLHFHQNIHGCTKLKLIFTFRLYAHMYCTQCAAALPPRAICAIRKDRVGSAALSSAKFAVSYIHVFRVFCGVSS